MKASIRVRYNGRTAFAGGGMQTNATNMIDRMRPVKDSRYLLSLLWWLRGLGLLGATELE